MGAALIAVDAGAIPDALWLTVSSQIEKELGIAPARVLLTATPRTAPADRAGQITVKKSPSKATMMATLTNGGCPLRLHPGRCIVRDVHV
jgi:hypothetical protein